MSLQHICDTFHISMPSVSKILDEYHIPRYTKAMVRNPYVLEDYFHIINTEEKAYFLGVIISKGFICLDGRQNRQTFLIIKAKPNNYSILEKFQQALQTKTTINYCHRDDVYEISIHSDVMVEDLGQYKIIPKQRLCKSLPDNISENLMNHLLRGIYDAGGALISKKDKYGYDFLHAFRFEGHPQLIEDISNYCYHHLNFKLKPSVVYTGYGEYEIKMQHTLDLIRLGQWLYKDATIYLQRKKDRYDKLVKNMMIPS